MVDGNFLYASSGLSSLGITKDGQLSIGRPAVFVSINDMSGNWLWDAFEVNSPHQGEYLSTLYTPAFGQSITVKAPGGVLTVRNGAISGYEYKAKGSTIAIPSDGYIVCMGDGVISTDYFRKPVIGTNVPAPARLAILSNRLKPVSHAAIKISVIGTAIAICFWLSPIKPNNSFISCPTTQISPPTEYAQIKSFTLGDGGESFFTILPYSSFDICKQITPCKYFHHIKL